jgi:hypothetical protein
MRGSAAWVSFPKTASVHHISDGGRVRIGRTEAWDREVHVVETVEKLGAKLKLHSLVDGEVFEDRHIDIEEARICQHITGGRCRRCRWH